MLFSRACLPFHLFIAIHQEEVLEYLEEQERSKEEAALRERQEVNETLSRQALHPKNNALGKGDPLDLDHCGPSSLQCFYGEDREHNDRKKDQQRQLRNWCSQGMKETYDKIDEEQQDKREYSKYALRHGQGEGKAPTRLGHFSDDGK